jgi:hypothetical protein
LAQIDLASAAPNSHTPPISPSAMVLRSVAILDWERMFIVNL